jgi:hypothetical protein
LALAICIPIKATDIVKIRFPVVMFAPHSHLGHPKATRNPPRPPAIPQDHRQPSRPSATPQGHQQPVEAKRDFEATCNSSRPPEATGLGVTSGLRVSQVHLSGLRGSRVASEVHSGGKNWPQGVAGGLRVSLGDRGWFWGVAGGFWGVSSGLERSQVAPEDWGVLKRSHVASRDLAWTQGIAGGLRVVAGDLKGCWWV